MNKISVVIPTLNAATTIEALIDRLSIQSVSPCEIVIIDSSSDDDTVRLAASSPTVKPIVIPRSEFNHGLTRHEAFLKTTGDIVCYLTQDAIPKDEHYLEKLIAPFEDEAIALTTGRQEPKEDARRYVQLVQGFNYPLESNTRGLEDIERLGIKTFFASDVCSAYRRTAYFECGGFGRVNTSEDMLMAATFLKHGWRIAYASEAVVLHSHNLSLSQQFRRNKEIGFFLKRHDEDLLHASETSEGVRLVNTVTKELVKELSFAELIRFGFDCLARLAGNRSGRRLAESIDMPSDRN